MNQHLQHILTIIQQDENLTAEQKNAISKSLKDADKELEITAFKLDRTEKVKRTTAILLEETIEELEQKRKAVEAQNRELEIETALEKVRAEAMGMKKPDDILDICKVMFTELQSLGFSELRNTLINFWDDDSSSLIDYDYSDDTGGNKAKLSYSSHPVFEQFQKKIRSSKDAFAKLVVTKEELESWKQRRRDSGEYEDPRLNDIDALYYYFYSIAVGAIGISTFSSITEEKLNVLKRFRNVFDFAYRRYADVSHAEAQTREAQIEVAVERVRAKALAMHKSEDLHSVVVALKKELMKLQIPDITAATIYLEQNDGSIRVLDLSDTAEEDGDKPQLQLDKVFRLEDTDPKLWIRRMWNRSENYFVLEADEDDFVRVVQWIKTVDTVGAEMAERIIKEKSIKKAWLPTVKLEKGVMNIDLLAPPTPEIENILLKMGAGFDLAYKRFLDLQKAEAQVREATIEASLERVRSKTMAMHGSDDVTTAIATMFTELEKLGVENMRCGIAIIHENITMEVWSVTNVDEGKTVKAAGSFNMNAHKLWQLFYDAWQNGSGLFHYYLAGKEKQDYIDILNNTPSYLSQPILDMPDMDFQSYHFDEGAIWTFSMQPHTEEQQQVMGRFTSVFSQTFRRYQDLQKAEAQAREAQIELALERVRARAMAMQKSDELSELVDTVFKELTKLDFSISMCIINIIDESSLSNMVWAANPDTGKPPESYYMKFEDYPFHHAMMKGYQERAVKFIYVIEGEEKKTYDEYLFTETEFRRMPTEAQAASKALKRYVASFTFSNFGGLQTVGDEALSDSNLDILARFGKVFDLTYTRFNDLKQAEAQAREAKIEAALERVRSRTMAMQKTDELLDAAELVHKELSSLGINSMNVSYAFVDEDEKLGSYYSVNPVDARIVPIPFVFPHTETEVMRSILSSWKKQEFFNVIELNEKATLKHQTYIGEHIQQQLAKNNIPFSIGDFLTISPKKAVLSTFNFSKGYLFNIGGERLSKTQEELMLRFTRVFEQTYIRFLDLQKAEAQAREAQIELALERVRARTMAMQHSEELKDIIQTITQQLQSLEFNFDSANFATQFTKKGFYVWNAAPGAAVLPQVYVPYKKNKFINWLFDNREQGTSFESLVFSKEEKNAFFNYYFNETEARQVPNEIKKYMLDGEAMAVSSAFRKNFVLSIFSYGVKVRSKAEEEIINRFAYVFEQSYTRFLDLQKAEAQSKEAQIELALERVRARTMAMQHSDELQDAAILLFQQMNTLGVQTGSCGFNIWNKDEKAATVWMSSAEGGLQTPFTMPHTESAIYKEVYEALKKGETFLVKEVGGKNLKKHFDYLLTLPGIGDIIKKLRETGYSFPETMVYHFAFFNQGYLSFHLHEHHPEAHDIFKRFGKVFEQTYTRFLDLQKAESQAKEAKIEAALERVRSRSMAMYKSDDLQGAVTIMFEEFQKLNLDVLRCGIGILNKDSRTGEVWATSVSDNGLAVHISANESFDTHPLMRLIYEYWQKQEDLTYILQGQDLINYYKAMDESQLKLPQSQLHFSEDQLKPQHYYAAMFNAGGLYAFRNKPFGPEDIKVMKRFASVVNLTYKRFLDLQKAEAQAREAQMEAALERVRSRSMGMQKSEELKEVIKIVYQQLTHLKINLDHAGFVVDYTPGGDWHFWIADAQDIPSKITHPYFESVWANQYNEAKEKGADFFATNLNFEEKNKFYNELLSYVPGLPEESKDFYLSCPGLAASTVLLENVGLYIENFLGIPYSDEENAILMRFGKVFQQTYTRFLDLQKAEAQAREAKIETALEKVRSRTMAMQKSIELGDVATVLFKEMNQLVENLWTCGFVLCEKDRAEDEWWLSTETGFIPAFYLPNTGDRVHENLYTGWKNGEMYRAEQIEGAELNQHYEWLMNIPVAKKVFDDMAAAGFQKPVWQKLHGAYFSKGYLVIITQVPCKGEEIFKRFAQVFDLTYTRFLDLQKAEAQAREAQIEAALERVRSRTMAMQKSDELPEAANVLFLQVQSLGIPAWSCGYNILAADKKSSTCIMSSEGEIQVPFVLPLTEHWSLLPWYEAIQNDLEFFVYGQGGEDLIEHYKYLATVPGLEKVFQQFDDAGISLPANQINHLVRFTNGFLLFITYESVPHAHDIFKRFGKVFEQTYTRFLDLQKAEAQTRESQIELGLERVRARAMAMQKSEELKELIGTVFTELTKLDLVLTRCLIMIYDLKTKGSTWWMANSEAPSDPIGLYIKYHEFPPYAAYIKAWQERKNKWQYILEGTEKKGWDDFLFTETELSQLPDFVIEGMKEPDRVYLNASFNSFGNLTLATLQPLSDEHFDILLRFAKVFDLTYTRFNDLQKAEAQAREAQIELGLERVRAKAMAMQKSDELKELIGTVSIELSKLHLDLDRCFIMIFNVETLGVTWWMSNPEEPLTPKGLFVKNHNHPPHVAFIKAWKERQLKWEYILEGVEKKNWDDYLFVETELSQLPDFVINNMKSVGKVYLSASFNNFGCLNLATLKPLSDEHFDIMLRFAKVFDLTYTRFNDLQKAEAQARESKIEAALERVRSRTMSMQKSDELSETAAEVFRQLILLGIEPNRLYIGIVKEETGDMEMWATDEDGTQVGKKFTFNKNENASVLKLYDGWKTQKKSVIVDMQGKELEDYFHYLNHVMHIPFKGGLTQKRRVQSVAYFSKGFIGMASPDGQGNETIQLLERFAAVFNLTFTRFNDLKIAEAHAEQAELDLIQLKEEKKRTEDALAELQVTQKQLIQSEKMASLGELTAGIAHEIQNPLNFVNNFSDVSTELVDEMNEEIEKGNLEDAKHIALDLKQNLEKINHHGKRAGDIVKGMLQHSRSSSSAVKEPTDINKLADEYLRLAYHGLRAKDKTFNATMKTEFDETIGNINIIPQDIGRVILNLITNAFYVVNEKKNDSTGSAGQSYEPTVSVSTKKIADKVLISVKDNGNGIPEKVLDKIFQPFFTTKPTGEGTGLGLSLSYDIVKAHGGELRVETRKGEGSEFIIQLSG